jgi:hypothetical protein
VQGELCHCSRADPSLYKDKANSNAASIMRRRTSRPIKPGTESMRIDAERLAAKAHLINAERLAANVHGLPHSPVEGTKAADEVMNSDILGPGSMMVRLLYPCLAKGLFIFTTGTQKDSHPYS